MIYLTNLTDKRNASNMNRHFVEEKNRIFKMGETHNLERSFLFMKLILIYAYFALLKLVDDDSTFRKTVKQNKQTDR